MFMHHVACYFDCINSIPYKEEVFSSSDDLRAELQSGANKICYSLVLTNILQSDAYKKYYSPELAKTHNSK